MEHGTLLEMIAQSNQEVYSNARENCCCGSVPILDLSTTEGQLITIANKVPTLTSFNINDPSLCCLFDAFDLFS